VGLGWAGQGRAGQARYDVYAAWCLSRPISGSGDFVDVLSHILCSDGNLI